MLGGIGAYTVHADTTIESSQDVQTTSVNQTNQVNNTNNSVTLNNNQPVDVQSSQAVQNNQVNQNNINTITAVAATNNSDSLDSNIYGTVNVKDWDYQNDSNTFNLTSYHGQDTRHIIVPNLNDFDNAGVNIGNATGVGISSKLARSLASQSLAFAISKTSGKYSDKVTATDNDWSNVFSKTGLINADVSNLDTRNITKMDFLFYDSTGLKTVGNLSHWDTSNVTDMAFMFCNITGVIGDLSHWDTSNVTDMDSMFHDYNGVIGDLSHWDTSNVTNMSYMFAWSSASVSGLNTWNIRQTTDMSDMFEGPYLPYKIVASNESGVILNQVTLKDSTGKILALIDTPTIYDSNKSVRSTIDGIVQAEIDKLNKLNHTSYETSKIISDGDDDYSIANATYVVSQSKTGLINYVDQDGKVVKTDQISGKVGDKVDVKVSLPDGYELANKYEQVPSTITVGDDGIKPININIKKIPVIKTGTINYIDPDGKVVKTDQISGKVGDKVDVKISLPDGYELANKDEQVPSTITVGDDGIGTISVNIKKIPVIKTGTINYIDPDGKVVKTDQISGKVGDKVDVKISLPDGYELANKDEQVPSNVTVTKDGIKTITVTIKKIPESQTGNTRTGFLSLNGHTYYFGNDGKEYRDRFYTNWGHTYYFGTDGARYTNQWSPDKKYYFGSDGAALTGQHKLDGVAYVFGVDGHVKMASPVAQTNSVSVASDK
ncbi:BspA family leucine-rich repeat surface protein [Limosilactobacillus coleohominis]|uniref:BspA family leucine-rich repeat surface protein n=1 Tax=Limosilactobacillus coleohominis TaxID=181675 RepID=UPI00195B0F6C|nr:BspA family leucine-rich repeat surface protein [Limosilactobacillus coleohominis]MBM6955558.1 BspA family leucine-rich repeat surface protein [Limosilactobacillus coleohominis]